MKMANLDEVQNQLRVSQRQLRGWQVERAQITHVLFAFRKAPTRDGGETLLLRYAAMPNQMRAMRAVVVSWSQDPFLTTQSLEYFEMLQAEEASWQELRGKIVQALQGDADGL